MVLPMPYKDKAKQLEYQRKWMAARRAEYFDGKSCVTCGSTESLELDHIDPATKVSHRIWSWSTERREAELAKCQPLCRDCHESKSVREFSGETHQNSKLSDSDVSKIRQLLTDGVSQTKIANEFGISQSQVSRIKIGSQHARLV